MAKYNEIYDLEYEIYKINDQEITLEQVIKLKSDNIKVLKEVLAFNKKKKEYFVRPVDNGNLNKSIWFLQRQQPRGVSKFTAEIVLEVFELRANERLGSTAIVSRINDKYDLDVSAEAVNQVLKRITWEHVEIPQELLDKAGSTKVNWQKKNKITPEDGKKILKLHDNGNGLSGAELSRMAEFNYSQSAINKYLRKHLGYMYGGVRKTYKKNK